MGKTYTVNAHRGDQTDCLLNLKNSVFIRATNFLEHVGAAHGGGVWIRVLLLLFRSAEPQQRLQPILSSVITANRDADLGAEELLFHNLKKVPRRD